MIEEDDCGAACPLFVAVVLGIWGVAIGVSLWAFYTVWGLMK